MIRMGIRRLEGPVEPMRKTYITRRKHQDLKEVLEVAHSMGRWVAGPIISHTCQCSQMNH
jgi:hypothetical protein